MRTVIVNGRTGVIAASNGQRGVPATRVFVLFDGDTKAESAADWFNVEDVTVTGRKF